MENLFHSLKGINEKKFLKNNKFKWLFTFGNVVHLLHICSHEIVIIGTGKRGKIRRGMGIYLLGNQVPCTGSRVSLYAQIYGPHPSHPISKNAAEVKKLVRYQPGEKHIAAVEMETL